mmetsp:Transcript_25455/g.60092  ORF Transcript_25455/g.60092 Transcript_25455/m.60092 type:complete len:230 (-) Transcript_25455:291-980(-)
MRTSSESLGGGCCVRGAMISLLNRPIRDVSGWSRTNWLRRHMMSTRRRRLVMPPPASLSRTTTASTTVPVNGPRPGLTGSPTRIRCARGVESSNHTLFSNTTMRLFWPCGAQLRRNKSGSSPCMLSGARHWVCMDDVVPRTVSHATSTSCSVDAASWAREKTPSGVASMLFSGSQSLGTHAGTAGGGSLDGPWRWVRSARISLRKMPGGRAKPKADRALSNGMFRHVTK